MDKDKHVVSLDDVMKIIAEVHHQDGNINPVDTLLVWGGDFEHITFQLRQRNDWPGSAVVEHSRTTMMICGIKIIASDYVPPGKIYKMHGSAVKFMMSQPGDSFEYLPSPELTGAANTNSYTSTDDPPDDHESPPPEHEPEKKAIGYDLKRKIQLD